MTFTVIVLLAVVLMGAWILRPAYKRWRDYLKDAPELKDAPFGTRVLVLFKGLRTKMLARLMDGLGVALPVINAAGEWIGGGGIDLNGILPAIPIGPASVLTPGQYAPLIFLAIGRLTDYLRNHTTTPPDTIDANLAKTVATESNYVQGTRPSPALSAIVAPAVPQKLPKLPKPAKKRAR
jgi:hypothetical protein